MIRILDNTLKPVFKNCEVLKENGAFQFSVNLTISVDNRIVSDFNGEPALFLITYHIVKYSRGLRMGYFRFYYPASLITDIKNEYLGELLSTLKLLSNKSLPEIIIMELKEEIGVHLKKHLTKSNYMEVASLFL